MALSSSCIVDSLASAVILLLPALAANPTPVVVKGRRPIDGGRLWIDGKRILGDGKTWEGLLAGVAVGTIAGYAAWLALGVDYTIIHALSVALGALLGDIAGSFVKRRLSLPRGAPAPLLDQLDFYVGAVAASYLLGCKWEPKTIIVTAALVAALHVASNVAAYLAGLKREPW